MIFKVFEVFLQFRNRHVLQFGDGLAVDLHVLRVLAQARAVAFGTEFAPAIARLHHPELDLVSVGGHEIEELCDAMHIVLHIAVPKQVVLLFGKVINGAINGEIEFGGIADEMAFPLAHDLAVPAGHRVLRHRQRAVGEDQIGVHAFHHARAGTGLARPVRVVETEHIHRRLLKRHAVGLEKVAEGLQHALFPFAEHRTHTLSFRKSHIHRIGHAGLLRRQIVGLETVHHHIQFLRIGFLFELDNIIDFK